MVTVATIFVTEVWFLTRIQYLVDELEDAIHVEHYLSDLDVHIHLDFYPGFNLVD